LKQRYQLIKGARGSKTALYIHRKHPQKVWNFTIISDFLIKLSFYHFTIFCYYSPIFKGSGTWPTPVLDLLLRPLPSTFTLLAGDSNLYHPLWDSFNRKSYRLEKLLDLVAN
jgi:hypothetical protein